jgi:hypothetical protein
MQELALDSDLSFRFQFVGCMLVGCGEKLTYEFCLGLS